MLGLPVEFVAAAIFGLASLTDWLDGYLARRRKQVTPLGQILDPLADKLLISATLISLVQLDLAPAWMVAVIIGREIRRHRPPQPRLLARPDDPGVALGKLKMVSQVVAILLLMLGWERFRAADGWAGARCGRCWSRRWCRRSTTTRDANNGVMLCGLARCLRRERRTGYRRNETWRNDTGVCSVLTAIGARGSLCAALSIHRGRAI